MFLSPYVPLLFMGEEYGETNPFLFFSDFGDVVLARAVKEGRAREFAFLHTGHEVPDPGSLETFQRSRLDWERPAQEPHRSVLAFYRELIRLRKSLPALAHLNRTGMEMSAHGKCFRLRRRSSGTGDILTGEIIALLNFEDQAVRVGLEAEDGEWILAMDSADARWSGPGSRVPVKADPGDSIEAQPRSFVLYARRDA